MKKFLCAILFLTMVISLSACGGKGVSTLVKHYGQEKQKQRILCLTAGQETVRIKRTAVR